MDWFYTYIFRRGAVGAAGNVARNQHTESTRPLDMDSQVARGRFAVHPVHVSVGVSATLLDVKRRLSIHWSEELRGVQAENVQMFLAQRGLLSAHKQLVSIDDLSAEYANGILVFKADFEHLSEESKKNRREYATSQLAVRSRLSSTINQARLAYAVSTADSAEIGAMFATTRSDTRGYNATMHLALTSPLPAQVALSRISSSCY